MSSEIRPIGSYEGIVLAESVAHYLERNAAARELLAQSNRFPSIEDASGTPIMHYESMVIGSVETVNIFDRDDRFVRLYPALPINGAAAADELAPIEVTLLQGDEPHGGLIALLQRMNDSNAIVSVYFYGDDCTTAQQVTGRVPR